MKYLFVVSRDSNEYRSFDFIASTASQLASNGGEVHFYLLENGVFAANDKGKDGHLQSLKRSGAKIYAEDVSLKVRGLLGKLGDGVTVSNMDELVDLMMEKTDRVTWY
ncbi:MAG: DsrH/TusB family sulfur metabolism protein [Candidatus Bathyarchaeia archaeon]